MTPESVAPDQQITITSQDFVGETITKITVGNVDCAIDSASGDNVVCTLGKMIYMCRNNTRSLYKNIRRRGQKLRTF